MAFRIEAGKLEARHDGQVKAVLEKRNFGLIVLGGSHDLTETVRRIAEGERG
jgi:hypothetical protein